MLDGCKGNILDIALLTVFLFAFAFIVLLSHVILDEFETAVAGTDVNTTYIDQGQAAVGMFDAMFIFVTIFLGIAVMISAFFIRTHPIVFVLSFILLMIFTVISSFFTNTFIEIVDIEPFATAVNSFPAMLNVMQNLPLIMTIIGVMVVIALYAKGGGESGV